MPTILGGLQINRAVGTASFEVLVSPPFTRFGRSGGRLLQPSLKDSFRHGSPRGGMFFIFSRHGYLMKTRISI
jgi:hypothetical protein